MQFKDLSIPEKFRKADWSTSKVKIRKWTLGVRNKILGECSKVRLLPGARTQPPTEFDWGQYQILVVLHCVEEAPWQVGNLATMSDIDPELGDWLYGEISNFNEGDTKNSDGSEESSEEKQAQITENNK